MMPRTRGLTIIPRINPNRIHHLLSGKSTRALIRAVIPNSKLRENEKNAPVMTPSKKRYVPIKPKTAAKNNPKVLFLGNCISCIFKYPLPQVKKLILKLIIAQLKQRESIDL